MTAPYIDARQAGRRNRPDWLVTLRTANGAQTFRFPDEAAAWKFLDEQDDESGDDAPPTHGIGSRAR